MCGIAGIVQPASMGSPPEESIQRMCAAMAHRGPDDEGAAEISGGGFRGWLGNRRLAILDLSPAGHQPMENESRAVCLTYNGEIYNFTELRSELERLGCRFRSKTDTEVILRGYEKWGRAVASKLRGMFVFALWDARQGELFLARGQTGIKPLYYAWRNGTLVFGSEIKTVLASGMVETDADDEAPALFLAHGYIPAPRTFFRHVSALEPGHYLVFNGKGLFKQRYYALDAAFRDASLHGISEREAVERTREILLDTVRRHLVSDAPIGAFLSGGVDSSAIVALMREAGHDPIRTVSVVFPGTSHDESHFASLAARRFRTEHVEVRVTLRDFMEHHDRFFAAMNQPTVDGVNTYFVSRAAERAGLKVVMSGVGGDEAFGGYNTFRALPQIAALSRALGRIPGGLAAARAIRAGGGFSRFHKAAALLSEGGAMTALYAAHRGLFRPEQIARILPDAAEKADSARLAAAGTVSVAGVASEWNQVALLETMGYMTHQLLPDTDVFSMAHSIELRVPFADRLVVEHAARMPVEYKERLSDANGRISSKPLLTAALRGMLPEEVIYREKKGFAFPMDAWLRGGFYETMREKIFACRAFDAASADGLLRDFERGRAHWSRVWSLYVLAWWQEEGLRAGAQDGKQSSAFSQPVAAPRARTAAEARAGQGAYDVFYRKMGFPLYQRWAGRPTMEMFARARDIERRTPEEIRAWQWERAREVLISAKKHVPYYRERWRGLDVESLAGWEEWKCVPFLEKDDVHAGAARFRSQRAVHAFAELRTSGSTGQPLTFYGSPLTASAGISAMMRCRAWWGVDFCERSALFIEHGHKFEKTLRQKAVMAVRPLRERIVNRLFFSAYRMSDGDLDRYYRKIVKFRPRYLSGYATSLYMLARYMQEHGLDGHRMGATHVFYTSEMLYPWQKMMMEETFGARVAGEYGMVELGVVAHECPAGSIHTMDDLFYVEEIPLDDDPSLAEIVVTTLYNTDAPLIRYRTGDLTHRRTAAEDCPCGLGLHVIGRIEGRSHDMLVSPSGQIIHGQVCTHIINHTGRVWQFQVTQEDLRDVRIRIVRAPGYGMEHEREIREKLGGMLGREVNLAFEYVDDIPFERSGKFRWVRSKVGALKREGVSAGV